MQDNKKLVVYFSYTGNTKKIAQKLKEELNCDILELKPIKPYSKNYQTVVDEEQNNESTKKVPKIQDINIDLNNYDEIIIGTPVWWYTIAPVIRTFLKQNDLSKKVVIPFATNAGWLGRTFEEIESLCPNSKVEEKMNIVFESYSTRLVTKETEIQNWINSIKNREEKL